MAAATPADRRTLRGPAVALLPPWDEYIVSYTDRDAAVRHLGAHGQDRLKTVGSALIVIDGRVRGSWKRAAAAGRVRVTLDFWTPASAVERAAVQKAAQRYARFLGSEVEA